MQSLRQNISQAENGNTKSSNKGAKDDPPQIVYDTISSVEHYSNSETSVYDIQTERSHNFFAEGILAHNSIIIDDPMKPDDAYSDVERTKINNRLLSTIMSRRNSRQTPIILIMQRLNEEDMTGFIEAGATGEKWEVLKLPALSKDDKPLWELKHTRDDLHRMRTASPLIFSGQYQQEPSPDEGTYFKFEWLRQTLSIPDIKTLAIYGASDYAVTSNGGDYTCHVVIGVDPENRMYLLDLWRGQSDSSVWVDAFCDLVKQWRPLGWAEETGQIRASLDPFITQRMRERQAYVYREVFPTRGDKSMRAQSIRGRMALNGLYYKQDAPWFVEFKNELLRFPVGKHDDQVDALGLVGQLLDKMVSGRKTNDTQQRTIGRKYKFDDDEGGTSWKLA
jgi:predicted phage terminase large subunit-like protein